MLRRWRSYKLRSLLWMKLVKKSLLLVSHGLFKIVDVGVDNVCRVWSIAITAG